MDERSDRAATLSLEDFAAITAALDAGLPREEVLDEAGLSAGAWEVAKGRWLARIAAEAERGRLQESRRYLELLGAAREHAAGKARRARWRRGTGAPTAETVPRPPPAVEAAPLADAAPAVEAAPLADVAPAVEAAAVADAAPAVEAAPLADAAPTPWRAAPRALRETATFSLSDVLAGGPVLPFQAAALPRPQPSEASPPAGGASADPGLVQTAPLPPLTPTAPLPFRTREAAPAPGGAQGAPAFGPRPPPGATTGPLPDLPSGPALPFRAPVDAASASPPPQPRAANAPGGVALTLAQYAWLCAELAASPASAEATFRRRGLDTAEQRASVDAAWQARLRQSPSEYHEWQALYREYSARRYTR